MAFNQTTFLNALNQTDASFEENWNSANKDKGMVNEVLGPSERLQLNQAIEKRGGLRFKYAPTNNYPGPRVEWIPFFENPMITESRKANYASQKIFLRNEPVRLYTGSEARKFKVDVHYSLIHMAYMVGQQDITDIFSMNNNRGDAYRDVIAIRQYLADVLERDTNSVGNTGVTDHELVREMNDRGNVTEGPWGPNRWWKNGIGPSEGTSRQGSNYWNFALLWVARTSPHWLRYHELLQKVINNIRSSVISTQQSPVKGPPLVDLKWGTMYDFTPCIITDYKIQPIENAGYDTKSLTAQRLKVSLSLEEFTNVNGNLQGKPTPTPPRGWDNIFETSRIDPLPADLRDTPVVTSNDMGGRS
tara:strand:+ start:1051 stop:2130 length:1080 start_codon:yes stop_codon:yes gene_type:complete